MTRLQAWQLALLLGASSGCASRTEVLITIDAEDGVRAQTHALGVRAWGAPRGALNIPSENMQEIAPFAGSALKWPTTIAIAPEGGDTTRLFRVEATAFAGADDGSTPVARARVISSFVAGRTIWIHLVLEDSCIGMLCDPATTCVNGNCVSARQDPSQLPDYVPDASYPDGGGFDAMPDAGPRCANSSECDDSIACTDDTCQNGTCLHSPNDSSCPADAFTCTTARCTGASAAPSGCTVELDRTSCADSVACTDDDCQPTDPSHDPTSGCVHTPNAANCMSGQHCDPTTGCQGASCDPVSCEMMTNPCVSSFMCSGTDCLPNYLCGSAGAMCCASGATMADRCCDDMLDCTSDSCGPAGCQHTALCDDSKACTVDSCGAGGCDHLPNSNLCPPDTICRNYDCNGPSPSGCAYTAQNEGMSCTAVGPCDGVARCQAGDCVCSCSSPADCQTPPACYVATCNGGICGMMPVGGGSCGPGCTCLSDGSCNCTTARDGGTRMDAGFDSGSGCGSCADAYDCTDDMCVAPGSCIHVPDDTYCRSLYTCATCSPSAATLGTHGCLVSVCGDGSVTAGGS